MKKINVLVFGIILLTIGCRKDAVKNLEGNEGIVYITEHDSSADFSNFQSFRVADSVSVVQDGRLQTREYTSYDSSLIASIKQAMIARGFQLQTDNTKSPDIGVNVARITTQYTGILSYSDYWDGYDSYWDPYYWGYGGYDYYFPYTFGTYTFREGALTIDMLDLKNPDTATSKINTVWTGLARGSGIFNSANIQEVVDNLFAQSAYVQH